MPTHNYSSAPGSGSPVMAKQFISNARDCESGSESFRYPQSSEGRGRGGPCEPANDHQQMGLGRDDDHQRLDEWSMLDGIVTPHLGNDGSSKGVRQPKHAGALNQVSFRFTIHKVFTRNPT
ncbi:hypothetical protein GH714_017225 [Hevea brasiliensis]|uniref:Uncharacterized protein n=1 Tax=Hevea brasiliensis TaxID=3981 RepID=A0A6A6MAV7_HEVBR|nr:hypothetical protein GH714_017225 [Hevea brasiliensis]